MNRVYLKEFFMEYAPQLFLGLASVILWVTFMIPVGAERRRAQTHYKPLSGFIGAFEVHTASAPAQTVVRQEPTPPSAAPLVVKAGMSPRKAAAVRLKALRAQTAAERKNSPNHAWPHLIAARTPSPTEISVVPSTVTVSSAAVAEKPVAAAPPAKVAAETADHVMDSYESDEAKYLLDRSKTQDGITVSLCGLSRKDHRFILKVAITNQGGEDLFIRELALRDGPAVRLSKSYFRLFVEPGRTHDGYVVFDPPRPGADIHVALKEDREKGRVVDLAVPYSF